MVPPLEKITLMRTNINTHLTRHTKRKLLKKIKTAKVLFPDKTKFKIEYSDEIMDVIIKLLDKEKSSRLGSNGGAKEILAHPLFKKTDPNKIYNKTMSIFIIIIIRICV